MRDRTKTKKKLSLRERLTRRKTHRLAAHVSREDQWDYDVPNIRLSRAFVVVVVLHIVAVGGILVFEVLKPDGRGSLPLSGGVDLAAADSGALNYVIPEGVKVDDPRVEGLEVYIVRAGDTVTSISGKYGVVQETIERQNGLDRGGRIFPGKRLFIPKDDTILSEPQIGLVAATNPGGASAGTLNQAVAEPQQSQRTVPVPLQQQPEIAALPEPPAPGAERARYAVTETPTPPPAAPAPVRPVSGQSGGSHVLARGETPYGIARRYSVNVNQLLKVNGISDPTTIKIGRALKIPSQR